MGMYTGLRVVATVKPEFADLVASVSKEAEWSDLVAEHPFLARFAADGRSCFIPKGGSSYMPDTWFDHVPGAEDECCNGRQFDRETRVWSFACSLKNYDGTIELFLEDVLPILVESVSLCETYCEEAESSSAHTFADGRFTCEWGKGTFSRYHEPHPFDGAFDE